MMQEEEQRIKPGTNKAVIFAVLKQVGAKGMSVADIMRAAAQQGLREFTDNQKGAVSAVCHPFPVFLTALLHVSCMNRNTVSMVFFWQCNVYKKS